MGETSAQKRQGRTAGKQQANGSGGMAEMSAGPTLEERLELKKERTRLVLWRRPIQTLNYFIRECLILATEYMVK